MWQADLTVGSAVCAADVSSGRARCTWLLTLQSLLLAAGLGRPAIEWRTTSKAVCAVAGQQHTCLSCNCLGSSGCHPPLAKFA